MGKHLVAIVSVCWVVGEGALPGLPGPQRRGAFLHAQHRQSGEEFLARRRTYEPPSARPDTARTAGRRAATRSG
ncbi:hypothetical protein GCM10009864_34580 [Streptomyces lunalinharesii]|uniref:Secreted protein n=1 Tax=Streptomyces lunalinharesii TaxID=333384 RepID=A0ABN3S297_9ACTN